MNQGQLNLLETHERSFDFLTDNAVLWQGYAPLANPVRDLGLSIQTRKSALVTQQINSKGATAGKILAQQAAIEATLQVSKLANAYALTQEDADLSIQTNRSKGHLQNLPDAQGIAVMRQMLLTITPHAAALIPYGVTAADLTTAQTAIDAAEDVLNAPRKVVNKKKTARQGILVAERMARAALAIIDKLITYFEKTHPEFVRTYINTRVKIDRRGGGGGDDTPPQP